MSQPTKRPIEEINREYERICTMLGDVTAHKAMLDRKEKALTTRIFELDAEAAAMRAANDNAEARPEAK